MLRESLFEHAAELFHEAAATPHLWPTALQAVADACGTAGSVVIPLYKGPDIAFPSPGIERYVDDFLRSGWGTGNPRMQRGVQLTMEGKKGLITDADMFTVDELRREPFLNEFMAPRNMGYSAGMVLASHGTELVLPFVLERTQQEGPFTPSEVKRMNRLMSVIKPAADLALRMGFAAAERFAESLSGRGSEFGLLGNSGRLVYVPSGFERYFGDCLTTRNGLPGSWSPHADRKLAAAIHRAIGRGTAIERAVQVIALPRKSGRHPILAQVVPIVGGLHDVFALARAVLILTDSDRNAPESEAAEALAGFGLTPAETRLAFRIGRGERLKDIAEAENIAMETARARVKAVFVKTGSHRQTELALLIARFTR